MLTVALLLKREEKKKITKTDEECDMNARDFKQ